MNTLLLDIISPGGHRPHRPIIIDRPIDPPVDNPVADSLQNSGNTAIDTLQQVGDQAVDTLTQSQSLLIDSGVGGSSSTALWTVAIAIVALIACISLAIAYRRRTMTAGA